MSLRVWLPLTKDLRNQGLDGVTVTTANTNVFQNEGKLGGKSLDVSGHYAFRVPSLVKKRVFSCSFWYKPITDSSLSDNWRRIVVFDTYTSDGSTTGALFRFESSYGYQSSNTSYCISIHNNPGEPIASIGTGLGATDGWNKWQHITITADGTTLRCYRDGAQVASGVMSNGGMLQGTVHIGYSGNRPVGRLNDFRLYDHCLSPMEVKELSKGLVLHYPLNRGGWGQINNIAATKVVNRSCNNFTYNSSTNEWSMSCPAGSGTWGYGIAISDTAIKWAINQTWVISMEVYVPRSIAWNCDINNKPDLADVSEYTGNDYDITGQRLVCTNGVMGNKTLQTGWNKIWFSQTAGTTYGLYNYSTNWGIVTTNESTAIDIKIKNIKGEIINAGLPIQPTPWCPNSADALGTALNINGTTEYDCSGFCNNGNKMTNTMTYTSDTAKYQVSTHFNGTYDGILIENLQLSNIINTAVTYAFWIKPEGESGARSVYFGSYSSTSWSIEKTTGNVLRSYWNGSPDETCSGATITDGVWQHICITKNGTSDIRVYINGVQKWSSTAAHNNLSFPTTYRIGRDARSNDGTPYKGLMSDFRIYATALSAEDVKSLYQNSAYIDSSGNVYGAVHEED